MSTETQEDRLARRIADLYANDPQFAAAKPDEAVERRGDDPGLRLPDVVRTVLEGYADRPALGTARRRIRHRPATGRTTAELLPRFDTVTYGQLWDRVQRRRRRLHDAAGAARRQGRHPRLHQRRLHRRRHRADPARRGVACRCRPARPSAQLQPIVAETEPRVIASSIDYVDDAVELVADRPRPRAPGGVRLPARGRRPARGARGRQGAARRAAARSIVETLAEVLDRGARCPRRAAVVADGDDPLRCSSTPPAAPAHPRARCTPRARSPTCGASAANSHWDDNQGVCPRSRSASCR